ncbi:hypothetical protein [Amycolatopsis sp. A1MSW2902]|uniref:hypothetical protein n=1 Tax=Amycolatopsis sp. A1MSW2902 TaxID=687413 RepID=UPI00307D8B55
MTTESSRRSFLATARANLDGTQAAALESAKKPDNSWTSVSQLSALQRQKLNADVSELTELLAPIAAIAEPRRVS